MRIIKSKSKNKNKEKVWENFWSNLKLVFVGIIATTGFVIVVMHLAIIQFVKGKQYSEKAYNQQVINQILSPSRGTIFDANGEILAQSIPVDTVSLNPGKVTYANGDEVEKEILAKGISDIFNITYEELIEKLNSKKSVIVIEKKVEKDKIDKLNSWKKENGITAGINVDEDSKRYYPYNTLASSLIGFCGTDNNGQYGLEQRWDAILTGTAGKVVTATDVFDNAISDEDEQYIAPENGSNIYLTIDTNIQYIAEKYLEQAMTENPTAVRGNVLIMNPQNGEILAMASNPNYNLNEPSSYKNTKYTEEEWKALEPNERTDTLLQLWKNSSVSGTYEPGSTFKLITASIGLEEGLVQTDTPGDFFCSGSYVVDPNEKPISCWRTNPHGSLTLRGALNNSCNPAFMQLGQRIGARLLYKYFNAYGLLDSVGSDIARAYPGTFTNLEDVGPVELATTSFGQRFEISPLQLVTAVSAICNDGVLVKPKIVKKIENNETKSIELIETKEIRQVISKDTADKVKDMMQSVVVDGTGRHARVEGYSMGGKSGTSEPRARHEEDGYVASFIAIAPIEKTQVVVLVSLSGLQKNVEHQGGAVAGPYAGKILYEVLPYLGITSSKTSSDNIDDTDEILTYVPNVKDLTIAEAKLKLHELGFNVICNSDVDENVLLVNEQTPKYGVTLSKDSVIRLYTADETEKTKVHVPNIKDMTVEQARNALKAINLNMKIEEGTTGIVISQDPIFEAQVEEGSVINVVIKEKLVDAQ